tara:strand:- start:809 stop:1435 length:627 start_codon:yes stop_codon:yes gene_type:complete
MTLKLNGSSSGSVSIDAPASTTGGADVALTLPVDDGGANEFLKTNGSGVLSWAAAGGGKVLQVVESRLNADAQTPTANNTWTDVNPNVTITPSANTSKIIVINSVQGIIYNTSHVEMRVLRKKGSGSYSEVFAPNGQYKQGTSWGACNWGYVFLDDPYGGSGTVEALNYKNQLWSNTQYNYCYYNYNGMTTSPDKQSIGTMIAVEIGA